MTLIDFRHAILLDFMTPAFRESVVSHVLNHRDQLPSDVQRKLDSAINKAVKIPQFPNQPARALASFLKQPIIDQFPHSESLVNAVLQSWFASQGALYAKVVSRLHNRDLDVDYPDFLGKQFKDFWTYQDWMAERDAVLTSHEDLNKDDVALMLCFATGKMPTNAEGVSEDQTPSMSHDILERARNYLEHLPAAASEWSNEIPDFLAFVTEIIDSKKVESEVAAVSAALNLQISELQDKHSSDLIYLELNVSLWTAFSGLLLSDLSDAQRKLEELIGLLESYERTPAVGLSVSETLALREEHDNLTQSIQNIKADLDHILAPDGGQPDKRLVPEVDPIAHTQEAEAERNAGLSGIGLSDGSLNFYPTTTDYYIELDNNLSQLVISPVATHEGSRINVTVRTSDENSIHVSESDRGVFVVAGLNVGQTVISIGVTVDDPNVSKTYTLNVTRAPSINATLTDILLSEGAIDFDPSVTDYRADVRNSVDGLSIAPIMTDNRSTVHVQANGEAEIPIEVMPPISGEYLISPLSIGETVISIVVTAEDLTVNQAYTVTVARAHSSDELVEEDLNLTSETARTEAVLVDGGATVTAIIDEAEQADAVDTTLVDGRVLETHLWSLVAHDDLAGAYWVAKSMAAQGNDPPVPPSLLMVVQGARWLSPESKTYSDDLYLIGSSIERSDDNYAHLLLSLAASLVPSIVAPETTLLGWLPAPNRAPEFDRIVAPIQTFRDNNEYPVLPEYISGDEGEQSLQAQIKKASTDAGKWLEQSRLFHQKYAPAVNVFRNLSGKDGLLYQMLALASHDKRDSIDIVKSHVDNLNRYGYIDEIIGQAADHSSPKRARIVGDAKNWLDRRIKEAKQLADRWCQLVFRELAGEQRKIDNRIPDQVSSLRSQLEIGAPAVLDALLELTTDANPPDIAACAMCAARSLEQLADYLKLGIQHAPYLEPLSIVDELRTIVSSTGSLPDEDNENGDLELAVSRRLLWVPTIALDHTGSFQEKDSLVDLGRDIIDSSDTRLEDAIRRRLDLHDFRFFDLLAPGLPTDKLASLKERYSEDLRVERKTVEEAVQSTRDAIDQASKDGVIEFEGARWDEYVQILEAVNADEALHFEPIHDVLDGIKDRLVTDAAERRDELMSEWEDLASNTVGIAGLDTAFFDTWMSTFEKASLADSLDIRVMEDSVSWFRNYRSGEEDAVPISIQEGGSEKSLEEFLAFNREIRQESEASARSPNPIERLRQELKGGV